MNTDLKLTAIAAVDPGWSVGRDRMMAVAISERPDGSQRLMAIVQDGEHVTLRPLEGLSHFHDRIRRDREVEK